MKDITVSVQVIKVYHVTVQAEDEDAAEKKVGAMSSLEIQEQGTVKDITTDYAEVVDTTEAETEAEV